MARRATALALAFGAAVAMLVPVEVGAVSSPVLQSVTCRGPTFCFAVGSSGSKPAVVRFDGAHWKTVATPAVSGGTLTGVACASTTRCFAVGSRGPLDKETTLIERWNGSSWQVMSSPNAVGASRLESVACPTSTFCAAVGTSTTNVFQTALIEHWNGQGWKIMPNPHLAGGDYSENELNGISCTSAKQCFAAGSIVWDATLKTLMLRWDGDAWAISARQRRGPGQNVLNAVACVTAHACMSVGNTQSDPPTRQLKDRWDGTTWHLTSGPEQISVDWLTNAVSCASSAACLAVGSRNYDLAYAERWNGSKWTPTKPRPGGTATLAGVACPTAQQCYAVGGNVVEQWRPGRWTTVASLS